MKTTPKETITEVYLLTFINGKRYVGITTRGVDWRIRQHKGLAARGKDHPLYRAWNKYGAPSVEVIFVGPLEEACKKEIELIKEWDLTKITNGYNLAFGGQTSPMTNPEIREKVANSHRGSKRSPEAVKRMSEAKKGKPSPMKGKVSPRKGKTLSAETKAKMSLAQKGRIVSEETRKKISNIQKGKSRKPTSEETKLKISIANKGQGAGRKLPQYVLEKMSSARKGEKHPGRGYKIWESRRRNALLKGTENESSPESD